MYQSTLKSVKTLFTHFYTLLNKFLRYFAFINIFLSCTLFINCNASHNPLIIFNASAVFQQMFKECLFGKKYVAVQIQSEECFGVELVKFLVDIYDCYTY